MLVVLTFCGKPKWSSRFTMLLSTTLVGGLSALSARSMKILAARLSPPLQQVALAMDSRQTFSSSSNKDGPGSSLLY